MRKKKEKKLKDKKEVKSTSKEQAKSQVEEQAKEQVDEKAEISEENNPEEVQVDAEVEEVEKVKEDSELEKLKEEVEKSKDKYLRLFAEFENYKRRTSKERIEYFKTANSEMMTAILPVLDDFDRGMVEIEKSEDKALVEGVKLIQEKLKNILSQKNLSEVKVVQGDEFDADIHEAITQIPAPNDDLKGKIIDVVEKGYQLGDKIIRFPKVVIGIK